MDDKNWIWYQFLSWPCMLVTTHQSWVLESRDLDSSQTRVTNFMTCDLTCQSSERLGTRLGLEPQRLLTWLGLEPPWLEKDLIHFTPNHRYKVEVIKCKPRHENEWRNLSDLEDAALCLWQDRSSLLTQTLANSCGLSALLDNLPPWSQGLSSLDSRTTL